MLVKKKYDELYVVKRRLKDELCRSLIAEWTSKKKENTYNCRFMSRNKSKPTESYRFEVMQLSQYPLTINEYHVDKKSS